MELKQGLLFGFGVFIAIAAILAYMGGAVADTSASSKGDDNIHTITVTGSGSVDVVPDLAKLGAGVVTTANKSSDAMAQNSQTMDAVISAIKGMGIPDKDIKTGRVSIEPVYNYYYQQSDPNALPKIVGYRATNTITVTVRDMSKVGQVIDAAYNAGANQMNGVTFQLSDDLQKSTYKQALASAIGDGSDKIKAIASAAGVDNVSLKSITESGTVYPQPYYDNLAYSGAAPRAATTPISPGEQKVQSTVTMVYTFG